jgi:hypothetical protein
MALPALLPAAGSFLAQSALGVGLTTGAVALAPQLGSLMGGNVNWKLNPDSKSDDDRVIEIDSKGNKTFKPLDNNNVKALFQGGWQGLAANAKERKAEAARKEALGKMEARAGRKEGLELLQLQATLENMKAGNDLNRAELELARTTQQNANTIAQGQLNNDSRRLTMEGERATTLAEEAKAARLDGRINQNNQIEASLHQNAVAEANRSYEFDVNNYNQREARRSAPVRTLMNIGAMLAGGRF